MPCADREGSGAQREKVEGYLFIVLSSRSERGEIKSKQD